MWLTLHKRPSNEIDYSMRSMKIKLLHKYDCFLPGFSFSTENRWEEVKNTGGCMVHIRLNAPY